MAARIRSRQTRVLWGKAFPLDDVGRMKHSWAALPGPHEAVPPGTRYLTVAETRLLFERTPHSEWIDHRWRIEGMLGTLRRGTPLLGKIVMWFQDHPSPERVIIVGNHTTAALYRHALESGRPLNLDVYREIAA